MNKTLLNKARLNVVSLNKALINGAVERHGSSAGGGGGPSKYIRFADPAVEAVLMANGVSSDGVGITKEDAAAVTSIGTWFKGNTVISSFDEFEYFTGVTFLGTSTTQEAGGAFYGCTNLRSIKLPSSVTNLRPGVFSGCTSLSSVGDLSHVVTIGIYSFRNSALSGKASLDSCTEIGWGAFNSTQITEVYAPVVQIIVAGSTNFNSTRYGAFANCKKLKKVFIGDTCTIINPYAFYGCEELEECTLPSGLVTLSWNTFQNCTKWKGVINLPNLVTLGRTAFMGSGIIRVDNLGKVERVESLNNAGTFQNCKGLLSATLPDTLTFLDRQTFSGCSALGFVDMKGNVTEIGYMAFDYCSVLETVICRAVIPPTLGTNVFRGTPIASGTGYIYVPDDSVEAYKAATNWSAYADRIHPLSELEGSPYITFADPEVERVLMENNVSSDGVGITMADAQAVTEIGYNWFRDNTAITSFDELQYFTRLKFLGNYYREGRGTFAGCTSLKSVIIPQEVTDIRNQAFRGCTSLESVNIDHLTNIGQHSFLQSGIKGEINCPYLQTLGYSAFARCPNITKVVDLGMVTDLKGAEWPADSNWGGFAQCTSLESVIINDCVTSIGYNMFYGCTALQWIKCYAVTPPSLGNANAFANTNNCPIYVPDASVDAYKAATIWSTYADRIKPMSERPRAYDIDKMFQPATTADNSQIINTGFHLFNDFPKWTLRVNVSDINFSKMGKNGSAVTCGDESGSPYAGIHIAKDRDMHSIKMDINPNGSYIINTAAPPTIIIRRNGDILESSTDGGSTYVTRMTSIASVVASSPRLETIPMIVGGYYDGNGNVGRPFYGRVKAELWEEIIDFA